MATGNHEAKDKNVGFEVQLVPDRKPTGNPLEMQRLEAQRTPGKHLARVSEVKTLDLVL